MRDVDKKMQDVDKKMWDDDEKMREIIVMRQGTCVTAKREK